MKNTSNKARRLGAASIMFTVLAGALCAERAYAQNPAATKKAAPKKPADALWYGEFTLTIKGKGKLEGKFEGDTDIEWKIDRTYYSNFQMAYLAPSPYSKNGVVYKARFPKVNPLSVKVTVADELKITTKGRYQHDSYENTTAITKWEQDKNETGDPPDFKLSINFDKDILSGTYNLVFVALPSTKQKNLKITKSTEIERSEYGFGGKPTHEVIPGETTWDLVTSLGVPQVSRTAELMGVMGDPVFGSKEGIVLPATFPDLIVYDSKDMQPDGPMIPGVPDSKTNVKIRVIARFSKTPIY